MSKGQDFSLVQLVQFSTESEDSGSAELVCVSVASRFDCYLIKGGGGGSHRLEPEASVS